MKPKFKIGDKVRIVRYAKQENYRGHSYPIGSIHIIENMEAVDSNNFNVTFLGGYGWWYAFYELEHAENALQKLKKRYMK